MELEAAIILTEVRVGDAYTTNYRLSSLVAGAYYFSVTTMDVDGLESSYAVEQAIIVK
jgi:hypothetical protein